MHIAATQSQQFWHTHLQAEIVSLGVIYAPSHGRSYIQLPRPRLLTAGILLPVSGPMHIPL